MFGSCLLFAATVLMICCTNGFSVVVQPGRAAHHRSAIRPLRVMSPTSNNDHQSPRPRCSWKQLKREIKWVIPAALGALSGLPMAGVRPVLASAPVMVPVRQEAVDPETEALYDNTKRIEKKNAEEHQAFQKKAREIADMQGQAARKRYEQEWEAERQEKALIKAQGLEKLKISLLEQGLDPFTDPEANRQIIEYEKGIDLAKVPGTKYYMEADFEKNQPKRSMKYQKAPHRFVIQCMVRELKQKGKDPLEYFEKNQDKTADLFNMSFQKASLLAAEYKEKMGEEPEETPEEGAKRLKEEARAEKAAAKAAAKDTKAKEREEVRRAKAQAKQQKQDEKAVAKAAAAVLAATTVAATATGEAVASGVDAVEDSMPSTTLVEGAQLQVPEGVDGSAKSLPSTSEKKGFPIGRVAGVVVTIGGGGYAFRVLQEMRERDEEERLRQYDLIMGRAKDFDAVDVDDIATPTLEKEMAEDEMELDDNDFTLEDENTSSSEDTASSLAAEEPKKKRRGFKSMFGRKNVNDRETDLTVLVSEGATAPEFSLLLSKLLTLGAPGRFPQVIALPGTMPMAEFDLEEAKALLEEAAASGSISNEEGAEIFANVVNCMLIDIVDLASSTLKEDDKVTVDAINVVVDFMNHAASLYDSVAEGVVIEPVTYGGTLGKNKLEQMYSKYAASGMMSMDEDFNARVGLLQDVFLISEKKAEGLMMKAMQKNMMKMLKDGEGMEGMDEMLKAMGGEGALGGLEALAGMDGEGGEPSPEQLKEMLLALKSMKDSGSIPPEELDAVRSQFREAFGSSIDEVMSDADKDQDTMGTEDKELLDLMKSILDDSR